MSFPSEQDFALFLLQLFVVLSCALALGAVFRRWGQPPVVGEILAGIFLGPSVLGAFTPELSTALFPPEHTQILGTLAWLGSVFLLLVAGTEVNLATLHREGRLVFTTSLMGIALPFVMGLGFGLYLPDSHLVDPNHQWIFASFMGVALSISAIPVVAKILMDLELLKTPVGHAGAEKNIRRTRDHSYQPLTTGVE